MSGNTELFRTTLGTSYWNILSLQGSQYSSCINNTIKAQLWKKTTVICSARITPTKCQVGQPQQQKIKSCQYNLCICILRSFNWHNHTTCGLHFFSCLNYTSKNFTYSKAVNTVSASKGPVKELLLCTKLIINKKPLWKIKTSECNYVIFNFIQFICMKSLISFFLHFWNLKAFWVTVAFYHYDFYYVVFKTIYNNYIWNINTKYISDSLASISSQK